MATAEQREQALEDARSKINELSQVDAATLARTSDLSPDINFKKAVPRFEEMLELCKQLSQRDLTRLTHQQLTAISGACDRLGNLIKQVRDFTLNQNTPGDVCNNIITGVSSAYDDVMNPLLLPLAFTATQATDYAKIEREAKGYHATMKAEADKLEKFIKEAHADAANALAAVKEQAAEAGVSTNAQIFIGESEKHHSHASAWLKATIITASITLIATVGFLIAAFVYHPADLPATIQYLVAKLFVLSTLFFSVFWCSRQYRSQKHNETLNKHRANALMTFRAFVEGTADERVKDAILLQAAQAAFVARPTGFDTPDQEPSTINPVVEILGKAFPQSNVGA